MKIKELDSLGIGLIDSLVTQLEGTYSVDGSKGTVYEITFPI